MPSTSVESSAAVITTTETVGVSSTASVAGPVAFAPLFVVGVPVVATPTAVPSNPSIVRASWAIDTAQLYVGFGLLYHVAQETTPEKQVALAWFEKVFFILSNFGLVTRMMSS